MSVTFRVEQPSTSRCCAVAALVWISGHALLTVAGDHFEVLGEFSHGAHRLDANDPQVLLIGDVQSAVEWTDYHVVFVVHVGNAGHSHVIANVILQGAQKQKKHLT